MGPSKNLVGKIFGRLTVTQLISHPASDNLNEKHIRRYLWVCQCTCGRVVKVRSDRLLEGKTISCGCLLADIQKADPAARPALVAWSKQAKKKIFEARGDVPFSLEPHPQTGADAHHRLPRGTYQSLFDAQKGVCAICGSPPPADRPLHLDHDHATMQVRGLLCHCCNIGLGNFKDDIMRMAKAIRYLTSNRPPFFSQTRQGASESPRQSTSESPSRTEKARERKAYEKEQREIKRDEADKLRNERAMEKEQKARLQAVRRAEVNRLLAERNARTEERLRKRRLEIARTKEEWLRAEDARVEVLAQARIARRDERRAAKLLEEEKQKREKEIALSPEVILAFEAKFGQGVERIFS